MNCPRSLAANALAVLALGLAIATVSRPLAAALPVPSAASPAPAPAAGLSPPVLEALLAAEFARAAGEERLAALYALRASEAMAAPALAGQAVEAALLAGDAELAARALERWQAIEPSSFRRDAMALRFHVFQGDDDRALETALRLLQRPEGVAAVVAGLEAPYPDGGVIARAVLRALRAAPAFPPRIEAWLAMAGLAQRLGDDALSGQWVEGLVAAFPDDPRAGLLRAERLGRRGEREAARAEVRRVLDMPGLGPEQRRIGAEALAVLGDPEGAAAAMARGPQDARSLGLRAGWLTRVGDLPGLRLLLGEAAALASAAPPGRVEPALLLLLGELAEQLQDWPEAERWYRRLTAGEAGEKARLRLGVVLARQGRQAEAVAALRALQNDEAVDGEVRRDAFLAEADLWEARRRRESAFEALGRGLAVLEDDPALRVARARLAARAGRGAEAEADLRAVLARDGAYPPALRALGALMLENGKPAAAREALQQAFELEPGAPTAASLGEALWLLGRTADARRVWEQGRALDPADPVLLDTLRRFGQ
ncbi:tetratricopeptide repeat protein [Silanimonas lenta]|uniref:tetratricopeptide repeat protein n=1 Tax=Silanimonas lenta TaxID=265429 RepID=UPI000407C24F|nr:tetratricopeptide repeat protein [Silanimonas lenta]